MFILKCIFIFIITFCNGQFYSIYKNALEKWRWNLLEISKFCQNCQLWKNYDCPINPHCGDASIESNQFCLDSSISIRDFCFKCYFIDLESIIMIFWNDTLSGKFTGEFTAKLTTAVRKSWCQLNSMPVSGTGKSRHYI